MQLDVYLDPDVLAALPEGPLGVAVSGGSDSLALLHLLHDWVGSTGRELFAVTVDHNLRRASTAEALTVRDIARGLGLSHQTLSWEGWDGSGNLQDKARQARRMLIGAWAKRYGIGAVALGHTADDQAETFLMRLSRGSGVEGLSGMEPVIEDQGIQWVRPLLHLRRGALRDYLTGREITWIDDPSNADPRFDRVRMREALTMLRDEGIDVPGIVATTKRLRSAKQVLFTATKDLADACCSLTAAGEMRIHKDALAAEPAIRLRLFSEAVRFVAGSYYAPRSYAVENVIDTIGTGTIGASLHGCLVRLDGDTLVVRREPARVGEPVPPGDIWDERWRIEGPEAPGATLGAVGSDGVDLCPDWRESGHSREALMTTPGLWVGEDLLSAPVAGLRPDWRAVFTPRSAFFGTVGEQS